MAGADIHPGFVLPDIIDTIGHGFPLLLVGEVVRLDPDWLSLPPPRSAWILVIANVFFLLGVHREGGLPGALLGLDPAIDVLELGLAVGMLSPLEGLAVGLQAVPRLFQQFGDRRATRRIAPLCQFLGQLPRAFTGPF